MKRTVNDANEIEGLKNGISDWLNKSTNGQLKDLSLNVSEVTAYPKCSVKTRFLSETRTVVKFTKTGDENVTTQKAPSGDIDPWSVKDETAGGEVNYRRLVEIESKTEVSQCKTCSGSGKLPCGECQGQATVYCKACRGDGKTVCPKCRRSGKVYCPKCEGRGRVFSESKQEYETCPDCQGKGNIPCSECTGGVIICSACEGKGRIPCADCGGTGTKQCKDCSGVGKITSGYGIEIIRTPLEEKKDVPNDELPAELTAGAVYRNAVSQRKVLDAGSGESLEQGISGEPEELKGIIRAAASSSKDSPDTKVVQKEVLLEEKLMYRVACRFGEKERTFWVSKGEKGVNCDKDLISQIYSDSLAEIKYAFQKGDVARADELMESLGKVKALEVEIKNIKKSETKRSLAVYMSGSFAGLALFSCAALPVLYSWKSGSPHVATMLVMSSAFNVAVAVLAGLAMFLLNLKNLKGTLKKACAGALVSVVLLSAAYIVLYINKVDPARGMDTQTIEKEYKQYFPFGLRTLASSEDIDFLESLLAKYEPTGVDLSKYEKDLAWLKGKLHKDEEQLKSIEATRKQIEGMQNKKKSRKARKSSGRKKRIIIKSAQ
ncbi:MAG: hypothetical protein JW803_01035 [Endomicrobiales bacterium]|nr:hypothetical protein [Endomicrobiales bacterium]